jgi:hypothetical protein
MALPLGSGKPCSVVPSRAALSTHRSNQIEKLVFDGMLWLRLELLQVVLTMWLGIEPVWMLVRTLRSFSVSLVTISFLIGAFLSIWILHGKH